jgi:hypothetical protein
LSGETSMYGRGGTLFARRLGGRNSLEDSGLSRWGGEGRPRGVLHPLVLL